MTAIPKRGISAIVCGGRDYADAATVNLALDALHRDRDIWFLATGGARGADLLAERWADHNRVPVYTYHANWRLHGKAAGPIRNRSMLRLQRPDLVVAFPGGAGTADMIAAAREAGVEVYEVGLSTAPQPAGPEGRE